MRVLFARFMILLTIVIIMIYCYHLEDALEIISLFWAITLFGLGIWSFTQPKYAYWAILLFDFFTIVLHAIIDNMNILWIATFHSPLIAGILCGIWRAYTRPYWLYNDKY